MSTAGLAPTGRLRIVHAIDTMGIGGTELNALRMAQSLDRARYSLSTICLTGPGPLSERYAELGIHLDYLHIRNLYGARTLMAVRELVQRFRTSRPDVVHAHDMYSNVLITLAARLAGIPVISSQRWAWTYPARRYRVLNRWAHRWSTIVVANSIAAGQEVREATGLPEQRVVLLPNIVPDELLAADSDGRRREARSLLQIPLHVPVVGCVCRLHPVKDLGTLLSAMALVLNEVPAARLVLIGDGPDAAMVRDMITRLSLEKCVLMTGHRDDAALLAGGFDVIALSSVTESFPNALLEGMAQGVPAVATNVGGTRELVRDGQNGLLVPARDPAALARAIATMLTDAEGRLAMGRSARAHVESAHGARAAARRLGSLYDELSLASRGAARA